MNKNSHKGSPPPVMLGPMSGIIAPKIRKWFRAFELKGTSPQLNNRENARIRLLNRLYLGLIPLLTIILFINIFLFKHAEGIFLVGLSLLSYVASMVASRRGHYVMGRWLAILPPIVTLSILTFYFGRPSGGSISFLVIGLGIVVLFGSWKSRLPLLLILMGAFASTEWYLYNYDPVIENTEYVGLLPPLVFTSNFIVMVAILFYFEEIVINSQKESTRLLEDLKEKNANLSQTNYELAHFAHTATHHFKAPLKNISVMLGLLERKMSDDVPKSVRTYVELVKGNSKHLYKLVEDIMMYSNLEDMLGEEKNETSVSDVVDKIVLNLQSFLAIHDAQVILENEFTVSMTAPHVELLLQNLIENGIRYNQSPQRQVSIRKVAPGANGQFAFSVEDNGIGISPEYHENIFGMFSRLYTNDEYEGTGIGLTVCRKIIQLYHGSIQINSIPGQGSTFIVSLPGS